MWPLGVFRSVLLSCFAGGGGQDHTGGMGYMYMGEYTDGGSKHSLFLNKQFVKKAM